LQALRERLAARKGPTSAPINDIRTKHDCEVKSYKTVLIPDNRRIDQSALLVMSAILVPPASLEPPSSLGVPFPHFRILAAMRRGGSLTF
jgi:hypothetical protein